MDGELSLVLLYYKFVCFWVLTGLKHYFFGWNFQGGVVGVW